MTNSRRRRSGSFKKPDVPYMAGRKVRSRPAFKWPKFGLPAFRFPAVRVDWMNAAIFVVLAVNVGLIGFGIRQCAGGKTAPPRKAGTEKTAVKVQAPAVAKESAARSASGLSSGAASVKSGGGSLASGGAGRNAPAAVPAKPKGPLQVEVLNGCGAPKIADRFTAYLRRKGYDVVRTDNFESFNVPATLVIDRRGDLPSARKLADALGVAKREVISETHDMYMVDATVVLGKNFRTLAAWKTIVEKPIAP
jgi:hypothetical protein